MTIVYYSKEKNPFLKHLENFSLSHKLKRSKRKKMEGESIHHIEDLGRILLQTENELKKMSKNLRSGADVSSVLERAQSQLHRKARIVLDSVMRNSIKTRDISSSASTSISTRHFAAPTKKTFQRKVGPLSLAGKTVIMTSPVASSKKSVPETKSYKQLKTQKREKIEPQNLHDLQTRGNPTVFVVREHLRFFDKLFLILWIFLNSEFLD